MDLLTSLANKPDDEVTLKDILRGMLEFPDGLNERLNVIENKLKEIDQVKADVEEIRSDLEETREAVSALGASEDPFPPNLSLVVTGLPVSDDEDEDALLQDVDTLIKDGLELGDVSIHSVKRIPPRSYANVAANGAEETSDETRPGLVKVRLASLPQKIRCLRNKQKLKQKGDYKGVFIRSAEDHASRLNRLNIDTLLRELGRRDSFRFSGSGRLMRVDESSGSSDGAERRSTRQSSRQAPATQTRSAGAAARGNGRRGGRN